MMLPRPKLNAPICRKKKISLYEKTLYVGSDAHKTRNAYLRYAYAHHAHGGHRSDAHPPTTGNGPRIMAVQRMGEAPLVVLRSPAIAVISFIFLRLLVSPFFCFCFLSIYFVFHFLPLIFFLFL